MTTKNGTFQQAKSFCSVPWSACVHVVDFGLNFPIGILGYPSSSTFFVFFVEKKQGIQKITPP